MARSYLIHAGNLDWQAINPDIFGSMIQAVADDEERGALGMHYTSVPNILKVLNPLFLDDLRAALAEAGDNERKLLNLRKRIARIRVFDPACGSGNFLVIAYKQLREIENTLNERRGERGQQVPILWPIIFASGHEIAFAHTSFKWANLASHNAGVTVAIVGIAKPAPKVRRLFALGDDGNTVAKEVAHINAYLVLGVNVVVEKAPSTLSSLADMVRGNMPYDGGHLLLSRDEVAALGLNSEQQARFIRSIYGSAEFIRGLERYCLWIEDSHLNEAMQITAIRQRIEGVRAMRLASRDSGAKEMAMRAHQMREMNAGVRHTIGVAAISSENRPFLPCGLLNGDQVVTNKMYALYDAPLWNLALIASRLHWVWIGTVCVRLEMRFSYSNTLGWNTFPVPLLTEQNKADLTRCAENILLAREAHFPATIADLYAPETMPDNLRHAHAQNDEVLERIYIGRRFKNDTERLEKLFELYTKMTAAAKAIPAGKTTRRKKHE